jgi:cell division protein FtsW
VAGATVALVLAVVTGEPLVAGVAIPLFLGLFGSRLDRWLDRQLWMDLDVGALVGDLRLPGRPRRRRRGGRRHRAQAPRTRRRMLVGSTLLLLFVGAAMAFSADTHSPGPLVIESQSATHLALFVTFGLVGVAVMLGIARIDPSRIRPVARPLMWTALALLVGALAAGGGGTGYAGFVGIGFLQIQASEVAKLALVIFAADAVDRGAGPSTPRLLLPAVGVLVCACLLIMLEPDVGAAFVCVFAVSSVLLAAGFPLRKLAANLGGLILLILSPILLSPVARADFFGFLKPGDLSSLAAFEAKQSLIAVGSGGLTGRGFGESIEKAYYLPNAPTDFVLSVVGEELGVLGILLVISLLATLIFAGLGIARGGRGRFEKCVAVGLTALIGGQGLLNVFAVLGLGPDTGATLPLVSYGSSSLLITLTAVGILLSVGNAESIREEKAADTGRHRPRRKPGLTDRRVGLIFATFLVMIGIAALRSVWVGTVEAGKLKAEANDQQVFTDYIPGRRGTILDRDGVPLAESGPAAEIAVVHDQVVDPRRTIAALRPILAPLDARDRSLFSAIRETSATGVYRDRPVSRRQLRQIANRELPGILAYRIFDRRPLHLGSLSAVIGTVDFFDNGKTGIEKRMQKTLNGRTGKRLLTQNALGETLRSDLTEPAHDGHDVTLTIDSRLQAHVEADLAVSGIARDGSTASASAVVMEADGAVSALAEDGGAAEGEIGEVGPISQPFEPGSVFDIVPIAGALDEGWTTPTETLDLSPERVGETVGDPRTGEGGDPDVEEVLAGSDDPGAILIALRLGPRRFDRWVAAFGFGRPTGIEVPGERRGEMPSATAPTVASLGEYAVGRDESTTLLQLAGAYAIFADGGIAEAPHIVGSVAGRPPRKPSTERVLSVRAAQETMRSIGEGESAEVASVDRRTGAYSSSDCSASFLGYASEDGSPSVVAVHVVSTEARALSEAEQVFRHITEQLR